MVGKRFLIKIISVLISVLLLTCCGSSNKSLDAYEHEYRLSVWVVYWDLDRVLEEVLHLKEHITSISYFAAYFDSKNQLVVPKKTTQIFKEIEAEFEGNEWSNYLTIVNDKIDADASSLKDVGVLRALFSSEDAMNAHIDAIISMATLGGFDGVEIDYEAIKKDMELWGLYSEFCKKLYEKATLKGLKMKVVLEPNVPIDKISLPIGPDYIMMCYNLHGMDGDPGPKADLEFISGLVKKMSDLPGNNGFALATGGFDWNNQGKKTALTEREAIELIEKYQVKTVRDEASMCNTFKYMDQEGKAHVVWYGDTVTINYWMAIIHEAGDYGISIWRLGGNVNE